MPTPKAPAPPGTPAPPAAPAQNGPQDNAEAAEKAAQKAAEQAKKKLASLKDGDTVRVALTRAYPMFFHEDDRRVAPGEEVRLTVCSSLRANFERGNLKLVD